MLEFLRIRAKNFGTWESLDFPLHDQGLVCIRGQTGAGKTSIFRAIRWALYGSTAEGLRVGELSPNKKPSAVRLDFRIGKHPYKLTRYRNHPDFKNKVVLEGYGVPQVDEDSLVADVTPHIFRIIRLPETVFCTTTYFAQRNFNYFHTLTENARKEYIESLAYGSLFAQCEERTRERQRRLEREIAAVEGELRGLEYSVKQLHEEHESASKAAATDIQFERVHLEALKFKQHEMKESIAQTMQDKEAALARVIQREKCQREMQHAVDMMAKMEELGDVCDICGSIIAGEQKERRIKQYKLQIAVLDQQTEKLQFGDAHKVLEEAEVRLEIQQGKLQDIEREMAGTEARMGELAKSVDTSALESVQKRLGLTMTNLKGLERDLQYIKFWTNGFSFRGLRSLVLHEVIRRFSVALNGFLLEAGHQAIPPLDLKLDGAKLVTDFGDRTYNSLSGGEKQITDICTGFALREVAEQYGKARTNLLVLDEPFEGLDRSLTVVAQDLLRSVARPTTLFITHQNIEADFDRVVEVRKIHGVSEMRAV